MENLAPSTSSVPGVAERAEPPRRRSVLRVVVPLVGVVALLAGLGAIKAAQIGQLIGAGKAMQASGPPPDSVGSAFSTKETWEETIATVGSVEAEKGVTLSNDSPGIVTKIRFESGQRVKQGDVLVEIDTSVERAQLASAIARKDLANTNAKRSKALVSGGVAPTSQLETDEATARTAVADAAALAAQIERKTVRAPFSGVLGIRLVNVGQYLNPGTPLAVIQSDDATFVDFTVPQQRLAEVTVGVPVRLLVGGEKAGALEGAIAAVDPSVDAVTRSVKLRATANDPDKKLRPGMFVKVAVVLASKRSVVVPATALVHASYGDSVFVVEPRPAGDDKPGKIARQQFVRTGELRGDFVALEDGLKGGEEVVTAGAFKLRNNGAINVTHDDVGKKPERAPTPENR